MSLALWLIVLCGALSIVYGIVTTRGLLAADAGTARMQEISAAVREGAQAYLKRQYTTIAIVGVVIFIIALFLLGWYSAIGFAIGAVLSGAAGFIGMNVSVRANVRVAQAATKSLGRRPRPRLQGGRGDRPPGRGPRPPRRHALFHRSSPGPGLCADQPHRHRRAGALSFGASLISIFARLGGGIFTKGADVGGDMVGKVEAGIPEDDPRNPATIADNVGDNVGDCAGMAADLFETYVVTAVATMVLAAIVLPDAYKLAGMVLPLAIGGACVVTSIIGTYFVKLGASNNIMGALYKGIIATGVLSLIVLYPVMSLVFGEPMARSISAASRRWSLFWCGVAGLVITGLIIWITEYYTGTGRRPVNSIAEASITGHGTNVIQGLAVSLESTALPALVIIAGIIVTFNLAGLFGIAVAVTTMLALAGMVVALDAFGPVTDNAGGIAEMAGLAKEVRHNTDALDAVGNTTKAVTKGYAIGSAGLGALVLFAAYTQDLKLLRRQCGRGQRSSTAGRGQLLARQSLCRGRPAVRWPVALSLRRHVDDGGRPRRAVGGGRGAPPVQGKAGHHEGHRKARLWPRRRHADQGGDQGDDHALAAAGAVADRRVLRDLLDRRHGRGLRRARRHADGRHRHRPLRRHLDDRRRRRLGQCQEDLRGRLHRQPRRRSTSRARTPTRRPSPATPSATPTRTRPARP